MTYMEDIMKIHGRNLHILTVAAVMLAGTFFSAGSAGAIDEGPLLSLKKPAPSVLCRYTLDKVSPPAVSLRCTPDPLAKADRWVHAYARCVDKYGWVHTHVGRDFRLKDGGVSTAYCRFGTVRLHEGNHIFHPGG